MKIKDLMKLFENADPDTKIYFSIYDGCCGDFDSLCDAEITPYLDHNNKSENYIDVRFAPLWFFDSCITSGTAKDAAKKHKKRNYGEDWQIGMPNKRVDKK